MAFRQTLVPRCVFSNWKVFDVVHGFPEKSNAENKVMIKQDQWVAHLLPMDVRQMSGEDLRDKIIEMKEELGSRMAVLAHHYQSDEIVELSDFRGDSLKLARKAAELKDAEYIVFCGVEFMVETAAIVCGKRQQVISPAPNAGCPLADTANINDVERAWKELSEIINVKRLIPITYVNSSSENKAFCGEHNGIVCTSSNAKEVMQWALNRGDRFFFMPDENLGRNSCNALEIPKDRVVVWDPSLPLGGFEAEDFENITGILWKGFCHVHTIFTRQQVKLARENYPGCKVVVHPECLEEVVQASDAAGSTSFIIRYVEEAEAGSTIIIGTEFHLVNRLAAQHDDKTILPLTESICPDMTRVNLRNLYWVIKNIGNVNVIRMDHRISEKALVALERMLSIK